MGFREKIKLINQILISPRIYCDVGSKTMNLVFNCSKKFFLEVDTFSICDLAIRFTLFLLFVHLTFL